MRTVNDILQAKGSAVHSIAPNALIKEALKQMAEHEIGALLVMKDDHPVGILSERDYARKIFLAGKRSTHCTVQEIMTSKVLFVTPATTVDQCMHLMTQKRIRHLPVLKGKKVVGLISIGDAVKAMIADRDSTIQQMENYISGHDLD